MLLSPQLPEDLQPYFFFPRYPHPYTGHYQAPQGMPVALPLAAETKPEEITLGFPCSLLPLLEVAPLHSLPLLHLPSFLEASHMPFQKVSLSPHPR